VDGGEDLVNGFLFERLFAKKVRKACSRTSYKTVPITTLNKYLYIGKSEIKVENSKKNTAIIGGLITAAYASVVYIYMSCNPQHAFLRWGSKRICPMSQLCGMRKNLIVHVNYWTTS
jgi:hypothetical protein